MNIPPFIQQHVQHTIESVGKDGKADTVFTDKERLLKRLGNANWRAFQAIQCQYGNVINLEDIHKAAQGWKKSLQGIEYPWLVWSVDEDWAYVQQKMVIKAGWTPIVGYDPRNGVPTKLVDGAILIDFNEGLNLPILYMHFPLDFIFMFAPRLAFFHSDLLIKPEKMRQLSELFISLPDGEIAMTNLTKIKFKWLQRFFPKPTKLFELAGCITQQASEDIYNQGCSMWQGWAFHPNCPNEVEFKARLEKHWDHGAGLLYWQESCRGKVTIIEETFLDEGHFSRTSKKSFKVLSSNNESRDTGMDLRGNYDVYQLAKNFEIDL